MSLYAQVTLQASTGNSEDNQVNGFAADAVNAGSADLDNWILAIAAFYNAMAGFGALRGIAQNGHLVKIYDVTLPAPNYPIYESSFNRNSAASPIDLPMELSLCISYANTVNNAVPRGRRRGRIYISGWGETNNATGRPGGTVVADAADAYADYVAATNAITTLEAGVWSRANSVVYPIDSVWCDDEWDIQRRRGGKPTARTTIPV